MKSLRPNCISLSCSRRKKQKQNRNSRREKIAFTKKVETVWRYEVRCDIKLSRYDELVRTDHRADTPPTIES